MAEYHYTAKGQAAGGQTWSVCGTVTTEQEGDFPLAVDEAQRDAFMQLTNGKAVYGHPGVGCRGPYRITHFSIDRI